MTMAIRGESLSMLCQYLGSQIFHDLAVFEMVDVVATNITMSSRLDQSVSFQCLSKGKGPEPKHPTVPNLLEWRSD